MSELIEIRQYHPAMPVYNDDDFEENEAAETPYILIAVRPNELGRAALAAFFQAAYDANVEIDDLGPKHVFFSDILGAIMQDNNLMGPTEYYGAICGVGQGQDDYEYEPGDADGLELSPLWASNLAGLIIPHN